MYHGRQLKKSCRAFVHTGSLSPVQAVSSIAAGVLLFSFCLLTEAPSRPVAELTVSLPSVVSLTLAPASAFAASAPEAAAAPTPTAGQRALQPVREYPIKYLTSLTGQKSKSSFWNFLLGPERVLALQKPHAVSVDPGTGLIYVTDTTLRQVFVFDQKGDFLRALGEGYLLSPVGVAAAEGKLFVSDSALKRIVVFNAEGRRVQEFGHFLGEEENLERPTGLDVDRQRRFLYVTDAVRHAVLVYTLEGNFIRRIGQRGAGEGQFNFPVDVKVGPEGRIYVADTLNYRVQVFDSEGRFLFRFGQIGDGLGDLPRPKGLAMDEKGRIYVTDCYLHVVQVFDPTGRVEFFFGQPGRDPARFFLPAGIAVDREGRILVADGGNRRVQVLQL